MGVLDDGIDLTQIAINRSSLFVFFLSVVLYIQFDPLNTEFQFVEEALWLGFFNYKLGVDGISITLLILTTSIMPIVFLSSWSIENRVKEYLIAFLVLCLFRSRIDTDVSDYRNLGWC